MKTQAQETRSLPWVSKGRHISKIERMAALLTMVDMDEEEELRFLWAHPEFEAGRGYYLG